MPYQLKGRKILITGGSRGLGAVIATTFAREGASVALNYVSDSSKAQETAEQISKQYSVKTVCLQADIGRSEDCENLVKNCIESLGGLDVVISNAGWTEFSNFADLHALSEEKWDKCWATNVKGNLHLFRAAQPTLSANVDGGVFIYTASTAGVSVSGSSMAYSVTKAAALHLMKCLAQTQGPKIRVNSVIPGLMLTEWGNRYSKEFVRDWEQQTPLKAIPEVEECAEIYVAIAKNQSMTGQQISIDCGWLLSH